MAEQEFEGDCEEEIPEETIDPASIADRTLPVEHFERASCGAHQWYDFYFAVTDHMVDLEDNIVFEVEVSAEQFELGALSVHLFAGTIPLNRVTQVHARPHGAESSRRARGARRTECPLLTVRPPRVRAARRVRPRRRHLLDRHPLD